MWPFRKNNSEPGVIVDPPVDLDRPVENPALTAALDAHAKVGSDETAQRLFAELNRANYLVATLDDQSDMTWRQQEGQLARPSSCSLRQRGHTFVFKVRNAYMVLIPCQLG